MKRIHTLLLLLVSALVWVGCSYEPAPELRRAEQLLEARPDSILNVLKAVDRDSLPSDRDRAYHGMLLGLAYVANFKPSEDDSLIHESLDYYREHGPDSMIIHCLYLSGLADKQHQRSVGALRKGEEGFDMAEKNGDLYWMGRFCSLIADAFDVSYNPVDALDYARRSAAYYKEAGRMENYYDMLLDMVHYYHWLKEGEKGYALIDSMLTLKDVKNNRRLWINCYNCLFYNQIYTGDYENGRESARVLMENYKEDELNAYQLTYMGKIAGHDKNYAEMKRYLDLGSKKTASSADTITLINGWLSYYFRIKDKDKIIEAYDSCLGMQNKVCLNVLKQSAVTEQRNMARIDLLESERRRTRDTAILAVVICLITVAAVILWICMSHKARLRRQELDERMNALFELRTEYEKATARIDELAAEASRASDAASRNAADAAGAWEAFRTTHRRRWETLNRLCTSYMNEKSKGANQTLAADVRKEFERMRQPQFLRELEELVDKSNGSLMERFRRDMAGRLSGEEMTMALLLFAGVPVPVITYITGQSRSQVYRMRQNLIDRLEAIGTPAAPYIDRLAGRE